MNTRYYEEFARRYQARITMVPIRHRYETLSNMYFDERQQMVEVELNARAFEELVGCDYRAEQDYRRERTERIMRDKFPAVGEAYNKYRMLLELYR